MGGHWDLVWTLWAVATLLSFALLEGWALATRRLDRTLSRRMRAWLGINPAKPRRRWGIALFVGGLVGFTVWFIPHIVAGWGA